MRELDRRERERAHARERHDRERERYDRERERDRDRRDREREQERALRDRERDRRERNRERRFGRDQSETVYIERESAGGLSFWKIVFIMTATAVALSVGVETGYIKRDFWNSIEKSFDDYNRSFPTHRDNPPKGG